MFQTDGIASAMALKRDHVWWAAARGPVLLEQGRKEEEKSERQRGQFVWCLVG